LLSQLHQRPVHSDANQPDGEWRARLQLREGLNKYFGKKGNSALTRIPDNNGAWTGQTGHISAEMLFTPIGIVRGPIYYIAGPPTMVAATRRTLAEVGVDEDDIRTEEFAGY